MTVNFMKSDYINLNNELCTKETVEKMVKEFNETSENDLRRNIYSKPNLNASVDELNFYGKVNKLIIEGNLVKADIDITNKELKQLITNIDYPICAVVWCELENRDNYTEIVKPKIQDFYYSNESAFKETNNE